MQKTSQLSPDVSIILACYNDAQYLEHSVKEIFKVLDMTRLNYEIIFVYDCGQDETLNIIDDIINTYGHTKNIKKIVHKENEGRGKSVRDGILESRGRVVGFIDVDLDIHPRYIPSMVSAILDDKYDVATAFRCYKVQPNIFCLWRDALSHGYRFLSRVLLHKNLMDSECGYKFFDREKVLPLVKISRYDKWFWDTEIMSYCIYSKYRIKEIASIFDRRSDKKSSVQIFDTVFTYFSNLVGFKIYLMRKQKELFKT